MTATFFEISDETLDDIMSMMKARMGNPAMHYKVRHTKTVEGGVMTTRISGTPYDVISLMAEFAARGMANDLISVTA